MTEAKRPLKVFLCHAHADRDAVRGLYTRLTQDGVDAWLDKENLLPGQDWELEIRKAVREADAVVVCLSKQFNQAGFRQKEVKWALDTAMEQPEGDIFIIPARLEDCGTLESLRKWHWVDLFELQGYEHLYRALQVRAGKIGAVLEAPRSEPFAKDQNDQAEQLSLALQEISATIKLSQASGGIRTTLQKILENIKLQFKVDAADILLYDSSTQDWRVVVEVGFSNIEESFPSFNREKAGLSISEPQIVQIADLTTLHDICIQREGFISYISVPLIAKGTVEGFLEIFHRSPLNLGDAQVTFIEILADQAARAIDNAVVVDDQQRSKLELTLAYDATIEGWVRALDLREKDLSGHTSRVVDLTLQLARNMGVAETTLPDIQRGALLHDVGKMGIPDDILLKEENLTDDEWEILKRHPQYAYNMLAPIEYLHGALDIPYCHHEKWDGTGYPSGLKGEEIPFAARLFSVVDVYDTLASNRPYRRGWTQDKIMDYIQDESGKSFDPQVVDAFIKMMRT